MRTISKPFAQKLLLAACSVLMLDSNVAGQQPESQAEYQQRATTMYNAVWMHYRQHQHRLFTENYPAGGQDSISYMQGAAKEREVSYLWPLSGLFSATNVLVSNKMLRENYLPFLDSLHMAYEQYRDTIRKPAGYQAYPFKLDKSDRYYDDNGLVGIDYADAYLATRRKQYLDRSKEAFRFILSGWDSTLGGGVPWLEGHRDQKPACSNGMATLTALKLFEATKDKYYLQWGIKFYDWMHDHLRDSAAVYWNDIKPDGKINYTQWTYNSGSMLEASLLLFQFTRKEQYLVEARQIAKGTFEHFTRLNKESTLAFHIDLPWFVTVLFRGYERLYQVDHDPVYLRPIIRSLNNAWAHAKDEYGFMTRSWTNKPSELSKPKWLLDQACIAELYARISLLNIE